MAEEIEKAKSSLSAIGLLTTSSLSEQYGPSWARDAVRPIRLLRNDIGRRGKITILKPHHADVLVCLLGREIVHIGHENQHTGLRIVIRRRGFQASSAQ